MEIFTSEKEDMSGERGHMMALPCKGTNFDVERPIVFTVQLLKVMNY